MKRKYYEIILLTIISFVLFFMIGNNTKASEIEINKIKVDIKGSVENPGVYELDENSTISDLVSKSGGFKEDADTSLINLSKRLSDQDVVVIYNTDEVLEMRNGSTNVKLIEKECMCPKVENIGCINDVLGTNVESGEKININTASIDELTTLTGIGKSKAEKIIEYRNNNLFVKIEDIMNVKGIGQAIFDKIKENITV